MRLWVHLVALVLITCTCSAQERVVPLATPKRPATRPVKPALIIGVFQQPTSSFDVWRSRGINTLVGYEAESGSRQISNHDWTEAAAAKGFYYIRQPSEDLQADARDPNLLAWMHADEPDVKKPPTDPQTLKERYTVWKKAAPAMPVFVNFSGGHVLRGKMTKETYLQYLQAADWVGNDFYPVTGYNRPDWLWKVGAAVDTLRDWSGGRPQFAFIETSAQRLAWTPKSTRGVTPAELRTLIWHAVIHGVKGIVYFPQQLKEGEFRYDATPTRVAMEMAAQNRRLTELAEILASPMNPAACAVSAAAPMEVGWRLAGKKLLVIALNFSDAPAKGQVIRLPPHLKGGAITEDFEPYELRIFEFDGGG